MSGSCGRSSISPCRRQTANDQRLKASLKEVYPRGQLKARMVQWMRGDRLIGGGVARCFPASPASPTSRASPSASSPTTKAPRRNTTSSSPGRCFPLDLGVGSRWTKARQNKVDAMRNGVSSTVSRRVRQDAPLLMKAESPLRLRKALVYFAGNQLIEQSVPARTQSRGKFSQMRGFIVRAKTKSHD